MKKVLSLLSIAALLIVTSCTKTPVAKFTVSKSVAEIDEEITFTNTSSDGVTYKWDFGDGSSSTEETSVHKFKAAGSYTVTLTAYSKKEKKSHESSQTITINAEQYRFSGTIDGASVSYNTAMPQFSLGFNNSSSIGGSLSTKIVGSFIYNSDNNDIPSIQIRIGTLSYVGGSEAPASDFTNFISPISYPYSNNAQAGVQIIYEDANGDVWRSDSGAQTGSTFAISSRTNTVNAFGEQQVSFRAIFNVKLYNSSGNVKNVTNGYFYGAFSNY